MSTAREGGVASGALGGENGVGEGERPPARRDAGALGECLGTRVRLVQLEGLDALAGEFVSARGGGGRGTRDCACHESLTTCLAS